MPRARCRPRPQHSGAARQRAAGAAEHRRRTARETNRAPGRARPRTDGRHRANLCGLALTGALAAGKRNGAAAGADAHEGSPPPFERGMDATPTNRDERGQSRGQGRAPRAERSAADQRVGGRRERRGARRAQGEGLAKQNTAAPCREPRSGRRPPAAGRAEKRNAGGGRGAHLQARRRAEPRPRNLRPLEPAGCITPMSGRWTDRAEKCEGCGGYCCRCEGWTLAISARPQPRNPVRAQT